jgi:hypothetical protein
MGLNILLLIVISMVGRILAALGMGIITYNGSTILLEMFIGEIRNQFSATPSAVLQIITLFGIPESLSIILGAYTASIPLHAFKKIGFL